jgi:hypothetical protein
MATEGTRRREAVLEKVVKMLRLARRAGTEAEAHTALTLAQKLMYAHDIAEHELEDAGRERSAPIEDTVVDETGHHVPWREYLAAIVAENFRCAYVISESRATGHVRLVLLGRREDATVAHEAFTAAAMVAAHLADMCAIKRVEGERSAARASFLTGFLKGLADRFAENAASSALLVVADPEVTQHAQAFTNAAPARGGGLATSDPGALHEGFESGYAHGSRTRRIDRG